MDCAYCHFKQKSRLCYWTSVAVHLVMIRITVQQIQHSRQIYELQWKTCVLRVDWKEWMDSVSLKWLGREGQGHTWSWLCLQEKFIKSESAMLIGFTANDQCWLSHFPCKNMHVHSTGVGNIQPANDTFSFNYLWLLYCQQGQGHGNSR